MKVNTFGGTLLVAGTSIGAGMLGLPVMTGPAGFLPSVFLLVSAWAFMAATGLMFAELCLYWKEQVNILTMAKKSLGKAGLVFAWIVYLFLFYSLLVAYFVGGGNLLGDLFSDNLQGANFLTTLVFALVFIAIVAMGRTVVDPINKISVFILFGAYFAFLFIGVKALDVNLLSMKNWNAIWPALPIAFTSFGFQGTIPTLASWMEYDAKKLRKAIICGTLISLAIYLAWQALILGIVPVDGKGGLQETMSQGRDAVYPLHFFTQNQAILILGRVFAFFAIITSLLGVGVALVDFWKDALKMLFFKHANDSFFSSRKTFDTRRLLLFVLAFLPPLLGALSSHHIFLQALGIAGGFGSAFLLGLLPISMVMVLQRKKKIQLFQESFQFLGRPFVLWLLVGFVCVEIVCELRALFAF